MDKSETSAEQAGKAIGSTRPKRTLGVEPLIHGDAVVSGGRLGAYTEIGAGSRLLNVNFGDYSYCDRFADLANAEIDRFASIASFVRVNPGDHPMERASLHHFMYRASMYWPDADDEAEIFERRAAKRVQIGPDAWLGYQAIILAGRRLGAGSALGAGAVLTKDTGPYEIWVGNPARKVRDRFPEPVKDRLMALAWWTWDHGRLREALDDFRSLCAEAFLERYGG